MRDAELRANVTKAYRVQSGTEQPTTAPIPAVDQDEPSLSRRRARLLGLMLMLGSALFVIGLLGVVWFIANRFL